MNERRKVEKGKTCPKQAKDRTRSWNLLFGKKCVNGEKKLGLA